MFVDRPTVHSQGLAGASRQPWLSHPKPVRRSALHNHPHIPLSRISSPYSSFTPPHSPLHSALLLLLVLILVFLLRAVLSRPLRPVILCKSSSQRVYIPSPLRDLPEEKRAPRGKKRATRAPFSSTIIHPTRSDQPPPPPTQPKMPKLPNAEDIAMMQANIADTLVTDIIVCTAVCGVASMVILALRFAARRIANIRIQPSDWLISIAWLNFAVFDVCFALSVKYGGGRHIILVTPAGARMLQIINIVNENIYCVSMAFIKFSILAMYGSIFPQKGFRWCLWAVASFMAFWAISCCFVAIFQCTPIEYGWNPTIPGGSCVNYGALVLVAGIFNIITDFVILTMPIPLVLKLNLSTQKKWMVILTFAVGGSACIVSIVRLAYALAVGSTVDGSWDNMPAGMLSVAELMFGLLAASIPTYRPIYRLMFNKNVGTTQRSFEHPSYGRETGQRSVKITAGGVTTDRSVGITVTDDIDIDLATYNGAWVRAFDEEEAKLFEVSGKASHSSGSL